MKGVVYVTCVGEGVAQHDALLRCQNMVYPAGEFRLLIGRREKSSS